MAQDNDFLDKATLSDEARKMAIYHQRMNAARNAPKSTSETRLALFIAERGITEAELRPFYRARRKGAKPRFDYQGFADRYDIDLCWLWDGDLDGLRRTAQKKPGPRTLSMKVRRAQKKELQEALLTIPSEYQHEVLAFVRGMAERLEAQLTRGRP